MEESGLLKSEKIFIEFGSGKGKLSHSLCECLDQEIRKKSFFILVDRKIYRHKSTGIDCVENFKRIKIDIKDLNLTSTIEHFASTDPSILSKPIVIFGKHLCGSATDLTLNCISKLKNFKLAGIFISLCCHHLCTWESLFGRNLFNNLQIDHQSFHLLTRLSGWYSAYHNSDLINDQSSEAYKKYMIGKRCKSVINYCRLLKSIETFDFEEFYLKEYVTTKESPENLCLVAY